jgi:hypothetical protein
MSGTQHEPGWRQGPDGTRHPSERKPKAPRPADQDRHDNRISWITGGIIAAVFVVSITALAVTKKSNTSATHSTPVPTPAPTSQLATAGARHPSTPAPPDGTPTGTAALPATGAVLWNGSGTDLQRGPQFSVPAGAKGWVENWTYDCRATGHSGAFITTIHGFGAGATADGGVHTEGMVGSGTNHYSDTGTFSITVDSACGWTDQAVTVP